MSYGSQSIEGENMMEKDVRISARVPRTLKELMRQFVALDVHINESDLIRDAIREKIQREAPELYKQLFQEAEK